MSFSITKEEADNAASNSPDIELREQDRWLPIANVARLMKYTLPATAKVSKDAKECMQECISEFISFITSEASDKCLRDKRKTINGEDILYSMHDLGFENYAEVLKIYLAKYREQQALKQERGETKVSKKLAKKREALLQEEVNVKAEDTPTHNEFADHNGPNSHEADGQNVDQTVHEQHQNHISSLGYEGQEKHGHSPDYFQQYNAEENGSHNGPDHNDMNLKDDLNVEVNLDQDHNIDEDHNIALEDERYSGFINGQEEGDLPNSNREHSKSHSQSDNGNVDDLSKLAAHEDLDLSMADRDYY